MSNDHVYGLACAGGGAHGAYQVGVLKYVHEHFCHGDASPFRVFTGTSAGSLNTAFCATRSYDAANSRLELEAMWEDFHVPAYHGNVVKNSLLKLIKEWTMPRSRRAASWSLLDPGPLHDVVARGWSREHFDRALAEGTTTGLAVSATELRSSRLVWFQEGPAAVAWNVPTGTSLETRIDVPHIAASCSVPLAFPPVSIGDHYYADGGVANKFPFTPAMNMGATRILSIATDQPLPQEMPEYRPGFKPHLAETISMLLEQLSLDHAPVQANIIEIFNFFCEQQSPSAADEPFGHILLGGTVSLSSYRPVEILLFAPSRRIRHTDIFNPDVFDEALEDKSTVLLFHKEFIRPLIDFGYEDARARHDELAEFFDPERPQRPSRYESGAGSSSTTTIA
jgi:NTE family protein